MKKIRTTTNFSFMNETPEAHSGVSFFLVKNDSISCLFVQKLKIKKVYYYKEDYQ